MDLEVLKKKISTFRGEGGRVRVTDNKLLMKILTAVSVAPKNLIFIPIPHLAFSTTKPSSMMLRTPLLVSLRKHDLATGDCLANFQRWI